MSIREVHKKRKSLSGKPTIVLTFFACLACWLTSYFYLVGFPASAGTAVYPLWNLMLDFPANPTVAYLLGVILSITIAFVIQHINDTDMIVGERTNLPFTLFSLMAAAAYGMHPFNEASIALLLLVLAVNSLFKSYQKPESTGSMFNAGVYIAVASLFVPRMLWFILLLWMGMYRFSMFNIKTFAASLTGVGSTFLLLFTVCLMIDDCSIATSLFSSLIDFEVYTFEMYHIGLSAVILLTIIAFLFISADAFNNSVRVRQMRFFMANMTFFIGLMIVLYKNDYDTFSAALFIPSSILIACFIESLRFYMRFIAYYLFITFGLLFYFYGLWNF
ncbi:MAG: DUF6427 family protein [Tannerella sp.]|jgi:heme/copper-type cytochrome/quinol oxidase subunit 4|nr:DUF6427 family protein [Tannerella sp.]